MGEEWNNPALETCLFPSSLSVIISAPSPSIGTLSLPYENYTEVVKQNPRGEDCQQVTVSRGPVLVLRRGLHPYRVLETIFVSTQPLCPSAHGKD
ncbi:hypothetical protein J6590_065916 [Homalodisca vitripennis]|nr:hypothetical protein J6590_065916 [Homalodisca vitripennis]